LDKYIINGGKPLTGEVTISGAKNSAVAILAGALAVDGECVIENIPNVGDVDTLMQIFESTGTLISRLSEYDYKIDARYTAPVAAAQELYSKNRASYYLLGAQLGRFGYAKVGTPGGCDFGFGSGGRPMDYHFKGFEALGATVTTSGGWITVEIKGKRLKGARIYLDFPSVGATINIMLAAIHAEGTTVIENAGMEPHIVDLANFLNSMGAEIRNAGTNTIRINGVEKLHGGTYTILPDQIEAGTYIAATVGTGGDVTIKNVVPRHLTCFTTKFIELGAQLTDLRDAVRVQRNPNTRLRHTNVKTAPYPGFPTDMQPQIATLLSFADGMSIITEDIWDNRFEYVKQLQNMGANITVNNRIAVVEGINRLVGAPVKSSDLRAGAAMVIAGLCAEGVTVVDDILKIERGYENLVSKLQSLGADIRRQGIAIDGERVIRLEESAA
jgi:UDP-N-acetylglucosamine 1-carboxyvinyltransferase